MLNLSFVAAGILLILPAATSFAALTGTEQAQRVADALTTTEVTQFKAKYSIMPPNAANPVEYEINFEYTSVPNDTLAGCNYLIDWTTGISGGHLHGFSAYFDGNHFRHHDTKLQEYHFSDDPVPFQVGKGVQRSAIFSDLLPVLIAEEMTALSQDTAYQYKVRETADDLIFTGTQRQQGYDVKHFSYTFDAKTLLPKHFSLEYNPASIAEQTVDIDFFDFVTDPKNINEEKLAKTYPEVFANLRASNFSALSLVGKEIPEFASLNTTRERYFHAKHTGFANVTLIAFIDPDNATASQTVNALRESVDNVAFPIDLIMTFRGKDIDVIENIVGYNIRPGETLLINAGSIAPAFGIADYPTIFICNSDGSVADIVTAYNQNLAQIVIDKATASK